MDLKLICDGVISATEFPVIQRRKRYRLLAVEIHSDSWTRTVDGRCAGRTDLIAYTVGRPASLCRAPGIGRRLSVIDVFAGKWALLGRRLMARNLYTH